MKVPFLDVASTYTELKGEIDVAIHRVLDSGYFILGQEVTAFESAFAKYLNARHCVGVGNGLDALKLALRALNIGEGDEVLVPAYTFIATWLAVDAVGGRCVPVDVDPDTYLINIQNAQSLVNQKTKCIIPVHLYGHPCDLAKVDEFAKKHKLAVIEDAAQAHGAEYGGQKIGSHSDAVCWSFYPGKNLGAFGDGGAISTNNTTIANHLKKLRNYGSQEKYLHTEKGLNSRLDPIQAAILNVKLRSLDEWNDRRHQVAAHYSEELSDQPVVLPETKNYARHAWHLYPIRTEKRDDLLAFLKERDIGCQIHYPIPPHLQKAYSEYRSMKGQLPVAEKIANTVMSLPIGPHLSQAQVSHVITSIRTFFE